MLVWSGPLSVPPRSAIQTGMTMWPLANSIPYPISPVSFLSKFIVKIFPFKPNLVNTGPKIFAAKISFLFCLTISILYVKNLYLPGDIVAAVLCVSAGLESFFSVCLGCHFYTILLRFRNA